MPQVGVLGVGGREGGGEGGGVAGGEVLYGPGDGGAGAGRLLVDAEVGYPGVAVDGVPLVEVDARGGVGEGAEVVDAEAGAVVQIVAPEEDSSLFVRVKLGIMSGCGSSGGRCAGRPHQ